MTFIWRLYIPMTNRFRRTRIFISHWPLDGNCMGVDGAKRGRWDSTLTKRTTSGRTDCPSKGSIDSRFTISRDWQTTISATNGSMRATSARAWAWVIGCRICFGQLGRSEGPVAPDVNPSQKNNNCHLIRLNESAREARDVACYRGGGTSGSGRSNRWRDGPVLAGQRPAATDRPGR